MGSNGLNMLTHFEGFSSTCYRDTEGIWTIGIGHACLGSSTDLPQFGVRCVAGSCSGSLTLAQAQQVLQADLSTFTACVNNNVNIPITQNQFDALTSFAFNIGCGGFQGSTLLRMMNSGTLTDADAQYQLTRWHSGCTTGLQRRRFAESQLFSSCDTSFPCTNSGCGISNNWPACHTNCQYCQACGGCSGDAWSMPTCANGNGPSPTSDTSTTAPPVVPTQRCGSSFSNANANCLTPCPRGIDSECPGSERCFAALSPNPCLFLNASAY